MLKMRLTAVRKEFFVKGRRIDAVGPIDLEIKSGEFLCIVGPSGCGKTTLLRILAGLEVQSDGEIQTYPDMHRQEADQGRGSDLPFNSMVFQEASIFPWKNVKANVEFGLKARGFSKKDRQEASLKIIEKVGLRGFEEALPHQLSGGMKQRVSIARALANDPEVLLMDEPFAALDEQTKIVLQAELLRIWEQNRKTVVYVTHSIDEAIILSDRILIMSARPGLIMDVIDVSEYFPRPRHVDEVKSSEKYGLMFGRVWDQLRGEVDAARRQEGEERNS